MRILIWGNTFPLMGGVERFVDLLGRALAARGHEVACLSDGDTGGRDEDGPFPVMRLPLAAAITGRDPAALVRLAPAARAAIRDFAPDVIHYNPSGIELMVVAQALRGLRVPLVTTLHIDIAGAVAARRAGTLGQVLRRSAAVVAISDFVAREAAAIDGIALRTIRNGLPPGPEPGPPAGTGGLIGLGRLVAEKGFDTAVEALPRIRAAHPGARLTLAGAGPEGPALRARADALGVGDALDLPGWILPGQTAAALAARDLVLVPSRWQEPFGLTALEAALAGRPSVAAAVGGLPEIVEDGVTGRLVPPDDPAALAAAVTALLDDPARAAAAGHRARARAVAEFGHAEMVGRYEALYREVAEG